MYVVPAAQQLIAVHRQLVTGALQCGAVQRLEDLWVRFDYVPDRDGPALLCSGCGGPPRENPPEPADDNAELTLI